MIYRLSVLSCIFIGVYLNAARAALLQQLPNTPGLNSNSSSAAAAEVDFHVNFFGRQYDKIWIDFEHGLIMLDKLVAYDPDEVKSFPNPNYLPNGTHMDLPLIAVYYAKREWNSTVNLALITETHLDDSSKAVSLWCSDLVHANVPDSGDFKCNNFVMISWIGSTDHFVRSTSGSFQVLLATSGDNTYVIFNYEKLTWQDSYINTKTLPKIGFNIGGGRRFISTPFSDSKDGVGLSEGEASILPSPADSSKTKGIYVYRISQRAEFVEGSCNSDSSQANANNEALRIYPPWGYFLGGQQVTVRGPCFDPSSAYSIVFDTDPKIIVSCSFVNKLSITCVLTDWFLRRGNIRFQLNRNNAPTKLSGNFHFTIVGAEIQISNITNDLNTTKFSVYWSKEAFGGSTVTAKQFKVSLYGYRENEEEAPMFRFLCILGNNTTNSHLNIEVAYLASNCLPRVNEGILDSGVFTVEDITSKRRIWSRPFLLDGFYMQTETAASLCQKLVRKDDAGNWKKTLPVCPCTQLQAEADFHFIAFSNSSNCYMSLPRPGITGTSVCCYRDDDSGLLIYSSNSNQSDISRLMRSSVLGSTFPLQVPIFSHLSKDLMFQRVCCRWSNQCTYYNQLRATKDCSIYRTPKMVSAYGSSDIKILRGSFYDYNLKGDYVLLSHDDLQLQGRFEQVVNVSSNEFVDWTGITAIGLNTSCSFGSSTVFMQHRKTNLPGLYLYIDGLQQNHVDVQFDGESKATRSVFRESSCVTAVYDFTEHGERVLLLLANGVSVNIKAVSQVLFIDVQLPNSWNITDVVHYGGLFVANEKPVTERSQSVMLFFNEAIKPSDYYDPNFVASPRQHFNEQRESVESYVFRLTGDVALQESTKKANDAARQFQQDLVNKEQTFCPHLDFKSPVTSSWDFRTGANISAQCEFNQTSIFVCQRSQESEILRAEWYPSPKDYNCIEIQIPRTNKQPEPAPLSKLAIGGIIAAVVVYCAISFVVYKNFNRWNQAKKRAVQSVILDDSVLVGIENARGQA